MKIKKLEALLRRIPRDHSSRKLIEEEMAKSRAGFRGEQSVDYHLRSLALNKHMVLHDVRLQNDESDYFQVDTLVVNSQYLLIIEIKNITGTLFFDQDFHQLIRTLDGEEEAFPDPIIQIRRQSRELEKWLQKYKLPAVPIHSLIDISNPATLVKTAPKHKEIFKKVIHAAAIPEKVAEFDAKLYRDVLTRKDSRKLVRYILKEHVPSNPDYLSQFKLKSSDILTGVHCPNCQYLPLVKKRGGWFCRECKAINATAHLYSLYDYYLLINQTITNRQLRIFFQLSSASVAYKLLNSLRLPYTGEARQRKYALSGYTWNRLEK